MNYLGMDGLHSSYEKEEKRANIETKLFGQLNRDNRVPWGKIKQQKASHEHSFVSPLQSQLRGDVVEYCLI